MYSKLRLYDPAKRNNVKRETEILRTLSHKNTIKLIEVIDDNQDLCVVMEYASGYSLASLAKMHSERRFEENFETKWIFREIVEGVRYCHEQNIIHRDLKMENILVDLEKKIVKIIDFGFGIIIRPEKHLQVFCGTPNYMSPELISKKPYIGISVDIWALGIILFAMLSGYFPFKGNSEIELFRKINKGNFNFHPSLSFEAKSLISGILNHNPLERFTIQQILEHSWLMNI